MSWLVTLVVASIIVLIGIYCKWIILVFRLIYRCVTLRNQGKLAIGNEVVYVAGGGDNRNCTLVISPTNHSHVRQCFRIDRENLKAYKALCGYDPDDNSIPVCYGETLFLALLLETVTSGKFCLSPLGLIHLRQTIVQHEALSKYVDSDLTLATTVKQYRELPRGVEVDIGLSITVNKDRCVWEGVVTLLSRADTTVRENRRDREREDSDDDLPNSRSLPVPGDCGVQYAWLTGDFNPHHLYPWTATLLGYRRPIAHGMWTLARAIAVLQEYQGDLAYGQVSLTCSFKRPLFMPAAIIVKHTSIADIFSSGCDVRVEDEATGVPHLIANVKIN